MDTQTLNAYQKNACQFIERYSHMSPERLHQLVDTFFIPQARTLEIGIASGRDLGRLIAQGHQVEGLDAVKEFVDHCRKKFPRVRLYQDSLPPLKKALKSAPYDNILASAVLMHLPQSDLIEAVGNLIAICKDGGRIIVTIRAKRADALDSGADFREEDGRLFTHIPQGKLIDLFASFGTDLLLCEKKPDHLRADIDWHNFVFEKTGADKRNGIDRIQEVIAKDKKTTSYKLALLRSIIHMAKYESHLAIYGDYNDLVYIPMKRLAFHWLKFYFPIIKSKNPIKQIRSSNRLAFEESVKELDYGGNELARLIDDYDDGSNTVPVDAVLQQIARTIKDQPMRYIGDFPGEVFPYISRDKMRESDLFEMRDNEYGSIGVPVTMWHDMKLFGHWIEDSIIIEWAKLTEKMNQDKNFARYFQILSEPVFAQRITNDVRSILSAKKVECVYTGQTIRKFDIDHVIPYSVWKNNDLWNLLPTSPARNSQKSNCIPDPKLLKARKDAVIGYWEMYENAYPQRFIYQTERALGCFHQSGWQNQAFDSFFEIVSRLSTRKVADTWLP